LFTLVMKFHDQQSSERCIRKLISRHFLEKTRTGWNETNESQILKSSSELTYRMYKLCKLLSVCTFQNHYDENIWSCQRRK
jgi:hypothetical protein